MKLIGAEAVEKGVDLQNAQVYVHVGSKKASTINFDGTQGKNRRAGWIPMGNWFAHVNTMAETENVTKTEHSGTIENFTGSEVSVNGSSFTVMDESGNPLEDQTLLRLLPGASLTIPYYIFKDNFLDGTKYQGYSVEIELGTQNVTDYDALIIDTMGNNNEGLKIYSQHAELAAGDGSLTAQFKEDEKEEIGFEEEIETYIRVF